MDELADIAGGGEHEAELLKEYGTLCSRHFRIHVEARPAGGGSCCRAVAVAARQSGRVRVLWVKWLS